MKLPYDYTSKESILEYGRKLLGKSLRELHPEACEYSTGKGRMGQSVEKYHFGIHRILKLSQTLLRQELN